MQTISQQRLQDNLNCSVVSPYLLGFYLHQLESCFLASLEFSLIFAVSFVAL
jgi:hypothetical protein